MSTPVVPRAAKVGTPHRHRRRTLLIVAAVVAALLLAWPATLAASSLFPPDEPDTVVEYPAVDGTLGSHLEDLQRSVEP